MTDYSRIREGICPDCAVPLKRKDGYGECPQCGFGWSTEGDEFTLHLHVNVPDALRGADTADTP